MQFYKTGLATGMNRKEQNLRFQILKNIHNPKYLNHDNLPEKKQSYFTYTRKAEVLYIARIYFGKQKRLNSMSCLPFSSERPGCRVIRITNDA